MSLQVWLPLTIDVRQQGLSGVTMSGSPASWTDGKLGKAATWSGNVANCVYNNTSDFNYTNNFSVAVWYKHKFTSGATQYAFTVGRADAGGYGYGLQPTATTQAYFRFGSVVYPINNLVQDTWYHLVMTVGNNKVIIYKDGVQVSSNNMPGTLPTYSDGNGLGLGCFHYGSNIYPFYGSLNDFRIYDHCLSPMEVKELSKGLVLHYPLNNNGYITNFSEIGNLLPNSKNMALGTADSSTGTWRIAGSNSMTRSRVAISDSPIGDCYAFQNEGVQTPSDGSCYGIDNTTYFEPNTEYRISMFARITSGAEGYAGYNIYNISEELGGSHTKIDKNYRVTPLNSNGSWTYCWYHIKTNSTATRNIYIGITTGSTSVTTQMCLVRIEKWNDGMDSNFEYDTSGFCNNGTRTATFTYTSDTPKYEVSTIFPENPANYIVTTGFKQQVFTWACWFKVLGAVEKSYQFILSEGRDMGSVGTNICTTKAGTGLYLDSHGIRSSTATISLSEWYHVALVCDGSQMSFYLNGQLIQSKVYTAETDYAQSNDAFVIGKMSHAYTNTTVYFPFNGQISDVRIYATALSADDVKSLYQNSAYIDSSGNVYGAVHSEV